MFCEIITEASIFPMETKKMCTDPHGPNLNPARPCHINILISQPGWHEVREPGSSIAKDLIDSKDPNHTLFCRETAFIAIYALFQG